MATVRIETDIEFDVAVAAAWFCRLSDDEMCKFFVAVAEIASSWEVPADYQWAAVGRQLRTCECSTTEARDMVKALADWTEE